MSLAKLFRGVLQISTSSGARYLKPRAWERLRLLWVFRNFNILPQQVLSDRQRRLVLAVSSRRRFANPENIDPVLVIGTVEMSALPLKISPVPHPFGARHRRAS
jgi:hypothetical protein